MTRSRPLLGLALGVWLLAGCPGSPDKTPIAPLPGVAAVGSGSTATAGPPTGSPESDPSFVPLDAVDGMELPPELFARITSARAKVPAKLTPEQKNAIDDLESRYQRIEAAALVDEETGDEDKPATNGMRQAEAIAQALAGFYWDRLRLFDPSLDAAVPEELVKAFATTGRPSR